MVFDFSEIYLSVDGWREEVGDMERRRGKGNEEKVKEILLLIWMGKGVGFEFRGNMYVDGWIIVCFCQ